MHAFMLNDRHHGGLRSGVFFRKPLWNRVGFHRAVVTMTKTADGVGISLF
jgi:hypothetical protein